MILYEPKCRASHNILLYLIAKCVHGYCYCQNGNLRIIRIQREFSHSMWIKIPLKNTSLTEIAKNSYGKIRIFKEDEILGSITYYWGLTSTVKRFSLKIKKITD